MNLLSLGSIVRGVGNIADDLFTSDEERLNAEIEEKRIYANIAQGQMRINANEARHGSIFVAGWRPAIGWIGAFALAYQFLIYPLMLWGWEFAKAQGWIPAEIQAPPVFELGPLLTIVMGMLGVGTMRSFDKLKKTDTKKVN